MPTSRRALLACAVTLCVAIAWVVWHTMDGAAMVAPVTLTAPDGTFQYLHVEGPLLMTWDTRTGVAQMCFIRPPTDHERARVDCGL